MKKIFIILFASIICTYMFVPNAQAKEKTLNQLQAEAKANREAYEQAKNQKALTEKEKADATAQKAKVQEEIKSIEAEMPKIQAEIEKIEKDIEVKDKEIKKLMSYVQISNGESAYLEYAFGASSFTDFIYRVSVAEQLSNYNEELIDGYNKDIKNLEIKQRELTAKQNELNKKEQELAVLEAKLTKEIENIQEGMLTKDEEYRTMENTIRNMKRMGCSGSETETACKRKIASQVGASANGTAMPIARGYLTSDYGQRTGEFHTGMDFSSGSVDPVYPVAAGKVINIDYGSSATCGNNRVYVLHNIGGVTYTTSYWHLISVSVSVGQIISIATPIGKMGGHGYKDPCASGGHVHLNLFNGYTTSNSGRINPRKIIPQAPSKGVYFSHR